MKKILLHLSVIFMIYLIVANAQSAVRYAHDAILMCIEMIIPTLFPFFICSGLLIYSGFCESLSKIFRFCMKPLFKISPSGSPAFVLGIISGYPLGAVTAGDLYKNNYISKTEAERLLAFCNNSGPLFILGSIGAAIYCNMSFGIMLYITHLLSALTVGILFRFYKRSSYSAPPTVMTSPKRGFGDIFNIAIQNSIKNMLTVCAAVLFFSVISRLFLDLFPLNNILSAAASGICEFATGTVKISNLSIPMAEKLIMTAAVVGFAGISVHIQVIAVVASTGLSVKPYIIGKILHGLIAALYTYIYLRLNPIITASVFDSSISKSFTASSMYQILTSLFLILACLICAVILYIHEKKKIY